MWTRSFAAALLLALQQRHIAWLLATASITETRRLNKIALLTPFLSVLLQAGLLGLVYSSLFAVNLASYVPYLAVNLALWQAFSTFIANAALYNETINRHLSFTLLSPYTLHLAGLVEAMTLLLVKLAAATLVVMIARWQPLAWSALPLASLGLMALTLQFFLAGLMAAYIFDRFRLLRALLPQLLFIAFLVTPVIWDKQQLARATWIADFNPLHHALGVVREPLLGHGMPWVSLAVTLLVCVIMAAGAAGIHYANRSLIVFRWIA